ncbi:hypothetical protein SANTM175S_09684 [Streptomyces antimycoticus]
MKGNSPWAARVPPTTEGLGSGPVGAAVALPGVRLKAARATAPAAEALLRCFRVFRNGLSFRGGFGAHVRLMPNKNPETSPKARG